MVIFFLASIIPANGPVSCVTTTVYSPGASLRASTGNPRGSPQPHGNIRPERVGFPAESRIVTLGG